ncbi:UDP-4-amino-4,6-dideoxy-N-acetyl-beta-L-altrosamine transaminase [Pelomonas cellulosilytica]|uniref:UDP-4-amino-4, 6-dideoxy-N-acetyl-beta-L-altrosamine transaminase n=1 Tax=Pelomonas cellulosilytica TaxID=2906762 RepID=A0ABS8XZD9_9BURK|nr:UDP-4-amino-4,6-dideoxy-N-acetyl-beta-L-altrosamine transaminase [Pelomonas sp. P8]MCE4556109.1 UDP-4-amino-4,6-dideoxy-N-acetyl-beta-L-altrosamine transaminase [Pelomonas sp. P8]
MTSRSLPYSRQDISEADIAAVTAVLRSDFLTQGQELPAFEAEFAAFHRLPHAIAVGNATQALHIACLALGVGPGSRVWTCTNSFLASANCARYCGADVDFVDIDPATRQISLPALSAKLEAAQRIGLLPQVVIPVDFAGLPCDWPALRTLADRHGFKLLQDASHATGATLHGTPMGANWADLSVFSFHAVKVLTTAEGGMVTTRDAVMATRLQRLRSHGMVREAADMLAAPDGPWSYEQQMLGYNYRMTELQAALGRSQLRRLPDMQARREALACRYDRILANLPLRLPPRREGAQSAWHLYAVELDDTALAVTSRKTVFEGLRAAGIGVQVHYIPIHTQPYYRALGFNPGDFPAAEDYYARTISLPLFPAMTEADQHRVADTLRPLLRG